MGGCSFESSEKLNKTLLFLIDLLNDNNINGWFVSYGTLLGLVRDNSCIDGDDDIDIILEKSNYDNIKKILENNFELWWPCPGMEGRILKTKPTDNYASIDIYMGEYINNDVRDIWENLNFIDCFSDAENKTFVKKTWNDKTIYYPNNYERVLKNLYGDDCLLVKRNEKSSIPTRDL